jgi:hypothetical protein
MNNRKVSIKDISHQLVHLASLRANIYLLSTWARPCDLPHHHQQWMISSLKNLPFQFYGKVLGKIIISFHPKWMFGIIFSSYWHVHVCWFLAATNVLSWFKERGQKIHWSKQMRDFFAWCPHFVIQFCSSKQYSCIIPSIFAVISHIDHQLQ